MSEENVQETTDATTEGTEPEVVETKKTLDQLSQEELVDYVKSLRKENASHRTAKQAKDKELEEFRAWKESQKTELERATERAEKAEKDKLSLLRVNAALSVGLTEEDVEFVHGETEDEIKASAQKLAQRFGNDEALAQVAGKQHVTDVFAGNRGLPVSDGPKDAKQAANQFISGLIWGQ